MPTLTFAARFAALSIAAALTIPLMVAAQPIQSPIAPPPFAPPPMERRAAPPATFVEPAPGLLARDERQSRLKAGDLVRLQSGGPLMTVRAIDGGVAICDWQSWTGEPRSDRFPVGALAVIGGPDYRLSPNTEPQRYRPCPADVTMSNGRNECLG